MPTPASPAKDQLLVKDIAAIVIVVRAIFIVSKARYCTSGTEGAKVVEEKEKHVEEAEFNEQRVNGEPKAKPSPPFPQIFKNQKEEKYFGKFIELLK